MLVKLVKLLSTLVVVWGIGKEKLL